MVVVLPTAKMSNYDYKDLIQPYWIDNRTDGFAIPSPSVTGNGRWYRCLILLPGDRNI